MKAYSSDKILKKVAWKNVDSHFIVLLGLQKKDVKDILKRPDKEKNLSIFARW